MMKQIGLLLILFLIELCAVQVVTQKAKPSCTNKGGICQYKGSNCTGPIWTGGGFCKKPGKYDCCTDCSKGTKRACRNLNGTCINAEATCDGSEKTTQGYCKQKNRCKCCYQPDKIVNAAFTIRNAKYNVNLRDPNSDEYKALKKEIEDSVKPHLEEKIPGFIDYSVEFFRNGSVIVDANVRTSEENSNTAENEVEHALTESGFSDVFVGARLCVPCKDRHLVQEACAAMKNDTTQLDFICVNARDRYDCLEKLKTKEVDVFNADAEDVFLAIEDGIDISGIATTRSVGKEDEPFRYLSVAVVRKLSFGNGLNDLEGSKSCHTGYGKTAGWHVPLSKLLKKGKLNPSCSKSASIDEIELSAVSSYFSQACIPGKWVPDIGINTRLKNDYSNLCELCGDQSQCDKNDIHAGYEGALECLIKDNDVAWTKYDVVNKFFDSKNVNQSEYGFLCQDGSIIDLDSDINECYWAARPWNLWITRASEEHKGKIVSALINAASATVHSQPKNWKQVLLGLNKGDIIKAILPDVSPSKYLNDAGFSTTFSSQACPAVDDVTLCVIGDTERKKCEALAAVLQSRRVQPALKCFGPSKDCVAAVTNGDADIVSLDGGQIFKGHIANEITPIISEVYGKYDANYFAVAAVKKSSGITKLAELKGKNSCHTGFGKTAGWKIPSVTLLDAGLIQKDGCNYVGPVANFFSASCVPGANVTETPTLCERCIGDPEATDPDASKCKKDSSEAYYDYTGAFRCLVEGGGDVAFIKHTTIGANTNSKGDLEWNKNLNSIDYQLLCKDNTTADITDYESCHLAKVPSHKVVTRYNSPAAEKEQIRILLLRASETFAENCNGFALFGDYGSDRDIIFKSSATKLINLSDDDDKELLNGNYYKALTELETCDP